MSVSRLCKFQNLVSAWHLLACSRANYIINEPATRKLEGGLLWGGFKRAHTFLMKAHGALTSVTCINSPHSHGHTTMNKLTLTLNLQV
jgi:hypothetical protein